MFKNRKGYLEWKKQNKIAEEKRKELFNNPISPEQFENAKKHQDILFRTIRKIDLESQRYSESIEMGTNIIAAGGFLVGGAASLITSGVTKALQKTKAISEKSHIARLLQNKTFVTMATGIGLSIYSLALQKEAARVGRFVAKNELMQNPENFIYFNDEQLNSVGNVEANKKEKSLNG
ncbi:MAG: hypothetical protein MZU97_09020 [Bacillus subtilis]|nr:hypothetical protein [Bacillus subtilis]